LLRDDVAFVERGINPIVCTAMHSTQSQREVAV
jgi:hypothetical protein